MEAFVERFRAKATKARQAQSRLKALQRMAPVPAIVTEQTQRFDLPNPQKPAAPPIVALQEASVGYGGRAPVLTGLSLRIDADDRIALLGQNGNGKSTLAKLLAGKIQACAGLCKRHPKLQVGYFAQHQLDELNPQASAYAHVRALMPEASEAQVRARTARFGLGTQKMDTPANDLSGGEKARLLLGLATFSGPDLLILDEPTNHLDVDAREALAQALADYEGAVILISHDRHLIETCADRLWLVGDGTARVFDGDIDDYRGQVLEGSSEPSRAARAGGARNSKERNSKEREGQAARRRMAAERRAEQAPLRARIRETESEIERLRKELKRLDASLTQSGLYARGSAEAARLARKRARAERAVIEAEERWLALSTELEEAKAGH
jgi:ATP-binding cassette subfamily F protein 3